MATMPRTVPVDQNIPLHGEPGAPAFGQFPVDRTGRIDLTIHRRTDTHHGATLRLLGHAAEYLVESRRFEMWASRADDEALHILMRLSREVFEDYAEGVAVRRRFHDWIMDKVVQQYD
jgi:hypothetical protein